VMEGVIRKPVLAYLAGYTAPMGRKVGHAGAIVEGSKGTIESKIKAFSEAGVPVARTPAEVVQIVKEVLKN